MTNRTNPQPRRQPRPGGTRQFRDVSGVLNIHKPSGVSSFGMVRQVRGILGVRRAGHCGTLDPMAEGVLVIVFGKATRRQSVYMSGTKTYRVRMQLGMTTNTGDTTGKIVTKRQREEVLSCLSRVAALRPRGIMGMILSLFKPGERSAERRIRSVLKKFTGTIQQVPPMFSALKHRGRRLYEMARKGETVERQPRTIKVYRIDLLSLQDTMLELRVECSRGTYIRTLCEDIGAALGCGATMAYLCREKVGNFDLSTAVDGKALRAMNCAELLGKALFKEEPARK